MSTIKKLLALTLALAMVLSVSAFAGYSADTYKDSASIDEDCEESVELMYALDIMTGDTNGNFRPEATITRAEVAKMIYVILNYGDDDKAVNYTGANIFSDVKAGDWYEGYVNYMATTKLVQGRGDGTFGPNDPVTCAEAAKMLLTAIGYSAADRGYTGANWSQNVLSDAAIVGLLDGYGYNTNIYAPRQWVAVMFDNALTDALTYNKMAPVITGGLLTSITGDKYDVVTMGYKYYGLKEVTGTAIATPDAYIDGTGKADDKEVIFDDDGDLYVMRGTGLKAADLGQTYRVIYKESSSSAYDGTAYSVSSVSDVAESRTLDVEVDVKYGTDANKAYNKYIFNIDEMAAPLGAKEVNVLFSGINEDATGKFVKMTVAEIEAVMTSDARNNNIWKAIDTDADGDIDYFYVTEYDYAYVETDGNHNKYGDYITAYDLSSDKDLAFNRETRLYVEDCIISEDELVEGNIVKYTWSLDDGQYVMEVLSLEEEITYDSRDAKNGVYELGGEDYMIADEAEPGIAADVLKVGNLGESVDYVADGDLIVWAALTDSNYTDIADVNAQLVLVLDVYAEYSGGTIRNQPAIQYMTIDGETHVAAYQDDVDGVSFNTLLNVMKLNDNYTTAKRDDDKNDPNYTVEGRLFIKHEGTKNRVWLEALIPNSVDADEPNAQLDASINLLDDYKIYDRAALSSTSSTVKLGDDKLAAEHSFFHGYFNSYGEAVYGVITTEELLNGKAADTYAQVLTLDNERGTRTTIVAGYIFTPDLDGNIDDGYLFVDEILRQTNDDYYRANVTFMDGTTAEINIYAVDGDLYEGALYTYGYNIVDDDYALAIVEVDDTDVEIIDLDDDYVIFNAAVLDNLKELELGDEIDNVANVTVAVTRDQNYDDSIVEDWIEGEADFYDYELMSYGFVALEDVTLGMIINDEKVSGDLQFSDFVYDSTEDVLYVITWVCMDRYTGENLTDSPLASLPNSEEAALIAAKAATQAALDAYINEWAAGWTAGDAAAAKASGMIAAQLDDMTIEELEAVAKLTKDEFQASDLWQGEVRETVIAMNAAAAEDKAAAEALAQKQAKADARAALINGKVIEVESVDEIDAKLKELVADSNAAFEIEMPDYTLEGSSGQKTIEGVKVTVAYYEAIASATITVKVVY